MKDASFLKDNYDTCPAANTDAVGGVKESWENILKKLDTVDCQNLLGKDMGDLKSVFDKVSRLNCPITLVPKDSTFLDVAIWSYYNLRLSESTIEKHLRYARFMQNHKVPVDFKNLSFENFRKHMLFREEIEHATAHALKHEWKAMQVFLKAYGQAIWPYKPPIAPEHKERNLPFPDHVREFLYYPYSQDPYETALYQYLFYHSYLIGWRVPSEICELKLSDVKFNSDGTGTVTITETKKHHSKRTIVPESYVLSSPSHKSLKNYLDKWRPQVINQYSGDAFYLQPNGKPFTVRHLGHKLSKHGKKVWSYFKPYDARHWCAIARLIETKCQTGNFDPYTVRNWLGHSKITTTENYLRHAEMYFKRYPKSWIHGALRILQHIGANWGKLRMDLKNRVLGKIKTLLTFSPVNTFRPGRAHNSLKEKLWGEFAHFLKLCFSVESFSLNRGFKSLSLFYNRGCTCCS